MSFTDRITAALAAIKEHNEALTDEKDRLNGESFVNNLKKLGGTSEDRLSSLSHEDILECFPSTLEIKPKILAKSLAKIFRGKEPDSTQIGSVDLKLVSKKKADKMLLDELVANFDPEDYTNAVGTRLAEIAKGQPFIVYSTGRTVDPMVTLALLKEIKQGFAGRNDFTLNGEIVKVYAIGDLPENYVDENPLYPGRPLRPDGTCDQTGRSWQGVPLEVRQLIRVAIEMKELVINHEMAHTIMEIAIGINPMTALTSRYRKAAVKFSDLKKIGTLPKLQIALVGNGRSENGKSFPQGQKVVWAYAPPVGTYGVVSRWNKK